MTPQSIDTSSLVYEIANHFDIGLTAGQARATIGGDRDSSESDLDWVSRILREVGIDNTPVLSLSQIDFSRSSDLFAVETAQTIFLIAYNDQSDSVVATDTREPSKRRPLNEFLLTAGRFPEYKLLHFYRQVTEEQGYLEKPQVCLPSGHCVSRHECVCVGNFCLLANCLQQNHSRAGPDILGRACQRHGDFADRRLHHQADPCEIP